MEFWNSDLYIWVGLPLLVFFARVFDVALGTMRIIYVSRGKRYLAPILGFIEVFVWITIVSQIVRSTNNFVAYFAYAAGFAAGNYVGMYIENRVALGTLVVRVIVQKQPQELVEHLRKAGYGVTAVDGEGSSGPVKLIYTIVKRRDLPEVTGIIHQSHPHAFLSIEDVRSTEEGVFPKHTQDHDGVLFGRKNK